MGADIAPMMRKVAEASAQRSVGNGSIDCTQPRSRRFQKVLASTPIQPTMMPNTSGRPKALVRGMLSKARRGEPKSAATVRPKAVKASSPGRSQGRISPAGGGGGGGGGPAASGLPRGGPAGGGAAGGGTAGGNEGSGADGGRSSMFGGSGRRGRWSATI